jgi:AbrB family looped-hinge helix DNA binding protein
MGVVTRLTTKYQTTIPAEVRSKLGIGKGDFVEFVIEGRSVRLKKARRRLREEEAFRLAQMDACGDWNTPEDDEAFRDL